MKLLICLLLLAFNGASWIGAPWDGEKIDKNNMPPAPELRKDFDVKAGVKSATLNITGLGFFRATLNGTRVGNEEFTPNESSYTHRDGLDKIFLPIDGDKFRGYRVYYLSYDVTDMLCSGENTISALLGNGFFSSDSRRWATSYGTPRFICELEITYKDGSVQRVLSGEDWKVRRSPILKNDLYDGEIYDSRLESGGSWEQAVLKKAPDGKLELQTGPADRVMETLKPESIKKLDNGDWEVEFPDLISGRVRLSGINAPRGREISIFFPCETAGNGDCKYIASGKGNESWAPLFSWWVFDKAIISGWEGELNASDIVAEAIYSDIQRTASFQCSNPLLNRMNEIWCRTATDNLHLGVASDCPHREKGPYTGDGEVSCTAFMHNFGTDAFYRKWLRDMSDCQNTETGYVPNGAPWHPGCGGGVPWGAAMNIIPWEHYLHYGDISVLQEHYTAMTEQLRHMLGWILPDGTMHQQMTSPQGGDPVYYLNLGEWVPPYTLPDNNLVHTWYLWRCATYTAAAAKALRRQEDYARYTALADSTAAAFHRKFYDPVTGSYSAGASAPGFKGDGSNIFALAMGVPQDRRDRVIAALKAELRATGGHLNTGVFASSLFFDVLCDIGMEDAAYEALTKTDFPSVGNWMEQGAKTFWEKWDGKDSRNHPMFGSVLVWLYRRVAGVRTDAQAPGYRHIIFQPTVVGDLSWASYSTETPLGQVAAKWTLEPSGLSSKGSRFTYSVTVPKGAEATVILPDGSRKDFAGTGRPRSFSCIVGKAEDYQISSPDGSISAKISVGKKLRYSVSVDGKEVLAPSEIAMDLDGGVAFGQDDKVLESRKEHRSGMLDSPLYKRSSVKDEFNQMTLSFKEFDLIFRMYDDGLAYRFCSKLTGNYQVLWETASFTFPDDVRAYVPYVKQHTETLESQFWNSFENTYSCDSLSKWDKSRLAFLPLAVEAAEGVNLCITEADLLDYPGMFLYNSDGGTSLGGVFAPYPKEVEQGGHNMLQGLVKSRESFIARVDGAAEFPWRVIAVSREDRKLADSDLVWKLSSACRNPEEYSWVKPGKVAWDWWNDWNISGVNFKSGINNETYKYYIDFASAHKIEYVILDEGWAVNKKADLFQVIPEIDLPMLCDYARSRNVGLILWAGYWAFDRDMEKVCETYSKMGVKGFKVDFMDRDDQQMVEFFVRAARTAAKYHLVLDFHGAFKPAGLTRTYPNVLNFEGVAGLEQLKWSNPDQVGYDVTIPFIRMLAGPLDYTQGAMRNANRKNFKAVNSEPMSQGTRCRQLAEYVIFESPLTMLCDSPTNYLSEPLCTDYIASCPTTWEETVAIDGKIGEYVVIARRKADKWYLGALTDWSGRDIEVDLSFLGDGSWSLESFRDGVNADRAASDFVHTEAAPAGDTLSVHLAPGGGFVGIFTKF